MRRRRVVALVLASLASAGLLIGVGRWEAARHAEEENEGMADVLTSIGPLDSPSLAAYRVLEDFDCLLYRRGAQPLALEVCVDRDGRVIEVIDRRVGEPRISSLREEPEASTLRVDRALVERLIRRMSAPG